MAANRDEASLAHLSPIPLSCSPVDHHQSVAWPLTSHGPALTSNLGLGDPWFRVFNRTMGKIQLVSLYFYYNPYTQTRNIYYSMLCIWLYGYSFSLCCQSLRTDSYSSSPHPESSIVRGDKIHREISTRWIILILFLPKTDIFQTSVVKRYNIFNWSESLDLHIKLPIS